MSNGSASYGFLSWLRRGLATGLQAPDVTPLGGAHVALPVQVSVTGGPVGASVSVSGLALYGPGEVTGFDPRAVVRVWPRPDASGVEPNYFPVIEFVPADLPWQFTPAAPDAVGRLRPWFCLIALKQEEYTVGRQSNGTPVLNVDPKAPLPILKQAWAWAHVQVAGGKSLEPSKSTDVDTVRQMLASNPQNLVARVMCPRRLDAHTKYTVFVVPTFTRGAQAGLGTPPAKDLDGLAQSWSDEVAPSRADVLQLPMYYSWNFATGDTGDFEYLVRQLNKNFDLTNVGVRPMDVSAPGAGLPGASPATHNVMLLEGALKPANAGTQWDAADLAVWTNALTALFQASIPVQTALPLYGRWHAARTALNPGQAPAWFDDLNTDPRLRVAAALGVLVVQAEQQQLMASAWEQGAGIAEINSELRHAQLGREVSSRLYKRHVAALPPNAALLVTGPVHSRISYTATDCVTSAAATRSVRAWLDACPAPRGFFDAQWRRAARVWGGARARTGGGLVRLTVNIFDGVLDGSFAAAPAPPLPSGMASTATAGIDAARLTAALATPPNGPSTAGPANYYPVGDTRRDRPAPPDKSDNRGTNWGTFGRAAQALVAALSFQPPAATTKCPIATGTLIAAVLAALDPAKTVPAAYAGRLQTQPSTWRGSDPLSPVYIAPEFPQPAFEPLRKLSQDWIIPGLDQVPPNTVAMLVSNERFIEAYMLGLNFELGRELLWNGFPTDQRGSYFRHFWDHGAALTPTGQLPDPQSRYDINVITKWGNPLGQNPNPNGLPAGTLFLLIRGELFRRYPNALVYATRAIVPAGKRTFPDPDASPAPQEKYPVFSGVLRPDVCFFAFDLQPKDAYGDPVNPDNPANPGWYFVLQEHAAETRFGLETAGPPFGQNVTDWLQMNWGRFATDETALSKIDYIDLDAALPDTSLAHAGLAWHAGDNSRAADIAYITLRDPVRVAIHASLLLPAPS